VTRKSEVRKKQVRKFPKKKPLPPSVVVDNVQPIFAIEGREKNGLPRDDRGGVPHSGKAIPPGGIKKSITVSAARRGKSAEQIGGVRPSAE